MLQKLDLSNCQLINSLVYSLPSSVPHLIVLRLNGVDVSGVDFRAWKKLIPALVVGRTPDSWEEHSNAEQPRCDTSCGWLNPPDCNHQSLSIILYSKSFHEECMKDTQPHAIRFPHSAFACWDEYAALLSSDVEFKSRLF